MNEDLENSSPSVCWLTQVTKLSVPSFLQDMDKDVQTKLVIILEIARHQQNCLLCGRSTRPSFSIFIPNLHFIYHGKDDYTSAKGTVCMYELGLLPCGHPDTPKSNTWVADVSSCNRPCQNSCTQGD